MPLVDFDKLFVEADNLRNNAQVDEAIKAYLRIAQLATEEDELSHRARAIHMAGVSAKDNVHDQGSYYRDAINYFRQAETLFIKLQENDALGALYRDQAIVNDYAQNFSEALRWFGKSVETLSRGNFLAQLGITYAKFGIHFFDQGDFEKAKSYLTKGLKLLEQEPEKGFYHATALFDLARVEFVCNELEKAKDLTETSLSWFEADHGQHEYQRRIAQHHGLLSLIVYRQGNEKEARRHAATFEKLLSSFHPQAAQVLRRDLQKLLEQSR